MAILPTPVERRSVNLLPRDLAGKGALNVLRAWSLTPKLYLPF